MKNQLTPSSSTPASLSMANELPNEIWLLILRLLPDKRYAALMGLVSQRFQALSKDRRLQAALKAPPVDYQATPKQTLCKQHFHPISIFDVAFSPDGTRLASGSDDHTVRIWDVKSGKCLHQLTGHWNIVNAVAFSPDGTRIASGSRDGTVRLWDVKSGKCLHKLTVNTSSVEDVEAVAFSPDGTRIASGSWDGTVRIWDVKSEKCLHQLTGHSDAVNAVTFSPDGTRLVSGSDDNTVRIWDVKSGKCLHQLTGHTSRVAAVTFSPDGMCLASGSWDNTVRVWDAQSGQCLHKLTGHTSRVAAVTFSPDGTRLISSDNNGTVRQWQFPILKLKNVTRATPSREKHSKPDNGNASKKNKRIQKRRQKGKGRSLPRHRKKKEKIKETKEQKAARENAILKQVPIRKMLHTLINTELPQWTGGRSQANLIQHAMARADQKYLQIFKKRYGQQANANAFRQGDAPIMTNRQYVTYQRPIPTVKDGYRKKKQDNMKKDAPIGKFKSIYQVASTKVGFSFGMFRNRTQEVARETIDTWLSTNEPKVSQPKAPTKSGRA